MIKKVSRKVFLNRYPNFPVANYYRNTFHFPEIYNSYILYVEARSTIGLCNNVAAELSGLLTGMDYQQMFVLGDTSTPWLVRDHDYKPVKRGLDYLVQHKISKSFNGAIVVDAVDLTEFLKHLFWLIRCNGILSAPNFCDAGFNALVSICQYGNIHFNTLNKDVDLLFNQTIINTKLCFLNEAQCGSYKIPHRRSTRANLI